MAVSDVLAAVDQAVEQHVQRADPGEVGALGRGGLARAQSAAAPAAAISANTDSEEARPAAVSHQRSPVPAGVSVRRPSARARAASRPGAP